MHQVQCFPFYRRHNIFKCHWCVLYEPACICQMAKLLPIVFAESLISAIDKYELQFSHIYFSENVSKCINLYHAFITNKFLVKLFCANKSHWFAYIGMFNNEGTLSNWHSWKWSHFGKFCRTVKDIISKSMDAL